MRFRSLVLLCSVSIFSVTQAQAECSVSASEKVATGYVYKDFGTLASNKPISQSDAIDTCGKATYDLTIIAGPAGKTADEIDLSIYYDTKLGVFKIELSPEYYAVNLHNSLLDPYDDIVELYADVSVPITRGKFTFAPVVRAVQVIGFGVIPSQTIIQPGGRMSFQISQRLTLNSDVRYSWNQTKQYGTIRFVTNIVNRLNDKTSIAIGFEGTNRTRSVLWLSLTRRF